MKILEIPESGKCGLTVTWRGRTGLYRRAYVVPRNPNTPEQTNARTNLAASASAYRALDAAAQDAWNSAALKLRTRSRLGSSGPLTGLQFYTKINSVLRLLGQDPVDVPPGQPNFPAVAPQNLVITNTSGVIALKLTCPGNPGEYTMIRACAPQNAGVRRTPNCAFIGTCPAPAAGSADITSLYVGRYGVPSVGTRVFVQANVMVDGFESARFTWSALVPTAS